MKYLFLILSISFSQTLFAQQEISLEDIWLNDVFSGQSIPGFNFQNDGKHFTRLVKNRIQEYDLTTGKATKVIFDGSDKMVTEYTADRAEILNLGANIISKETVPLIIDTYTFSADESKILIGAGPDSIYRRSSKSNAYVLDRKTGALANVSPMGKQMHTTFSPSADKVAYVRDNNLYLRILDEAKEQKITTDGKFNHIINGSADWVYEEEFSMSKAFEWSPDGTKIAFLRFDESEVKEFTMQMFYNGSYPKNQSFKYPKVGEDNAVVSVHIYNLKTGQTIKAATGAGEYFPRLFWTSKSNQLVIYKLNRHQNELELLLADAATGKTSMLLKETDKYYVDIHDNLTFLEDDQHFLWTSEKDGYNHIYLYDMKGQLKKQLTKGNFEVTDFYGFDEKRQELFYQAAKESPLDRQVYAVDLKGEKDRKITPAAGTNEVQFSSTFDYYVTTHSTANEPPSYVVYNRKGKKIRTIEENLELRAVQKKYGASPIEFFDFTTSENIKLNGYMIKPPNFDPQKEYPVFMYVYGGPGNQIVENSFGGARQWWFQMIAQKGYIVASVDNRGTGGRGADFKKMTYLQLGKYETIDQIEAAKYLGGLSYVDKDRIGIFGWSYGGYMSALALFKGADVFKMGIAVAPVTNWKWYDTVYTERYMRTEEENPDGYRDNSPINFANQLKGEFLLIHGMGDDNVHFQNSVELIRALLSAGKHFDSFFYPNRNHRIQGGNISFHLYTKMTNFILENL